MAIRVGDPARWQAARLDTHGQGLVGTARRRPDVKEEPHGEDLSLTIVVVEGLIHTGEELSLRSKESHAARS